MLKILASSAAITRFNGAVMRNQPAKIAFVLPNFFAGGAERVMITVANNLDRAQFQPMIIAFDDKGPLRELVAADIEIISLHSSRISHGGSAFIRAVKNTTPDLIISTMFHLNMLVLLMKPFIPDIPVIVREAVTPSYFQDNHFKRFLLIIGYYFIFPFADKILSPTKLVFDQMPGFLKRKSKKLAVIHNPVDADSIRAKIDPQLRQSLARNDQRLFVGAGRLVDQKGFDRLIEALQGWKARDDWRLIILGEGPDRDKLQGLIDKSGFHQITLAGFQSNPWAYYAAADAFVLPSRHEGLPNAALESLAMGTPVIASVSAGGIQEIAEKSLNGTVFIARKMDQFVGYMNDVRIKVAQDNTLPPDFTLANVVGMYQAVFSNLIYGDA